MSIDAPNIPTCADCGEILFARPKGCSNSACKHSMTFKLEALRVAAQAHLDWLGRMPEDERHEYGVCSRDWDGNVENKCDCRYGPIVAALEAALKAVGS